MGKIKKIRDARKGNGSKDAYSLSLNSKFLEQTNIPLFRKKEKQSN